MTNEWEEMVADWQAVEWSELRQSTFLRHMEDLEQDMSDAFSAYERLMRVREAAGDVMNDNRELRLEYFKRLTERMTNEQGSSPEA